MKHNLLGNIKLNAGLLVALAMAALLSVTVHAAEPMKPMKGGEHMMMMQMQPIMTQTQAEALKPGDAMSMTCTKCKYVMIQKVSGDMAHVKMMTVGEKLMCHACDGTVEVIATGKGEGKDAEVKHVCSKCGDDAMFCSAVKPGTGSFYEKQKDVQGR